MRYIFTLVLVGSIAVVCAWALDEVLCLFLGCIEEDAVGPEAGLTIVVIPLYSIITVGLFTSALALHNKGLSIWLSSAIPSLTISLAISALLYVPEVDTVTGTFSFYVWLATPWLICSFVGLLLWPKNRSVATHNV